MMIIRPETHSILRLKNDFIVLHDIFQNEYFQIRNGNDVFYVVGYNENFGEVGYWDAGDDHVPRLWNRKIRIESEEINYALRFRPGDLVRTRDGQLIKICCIPSNCGHGDYGRWEVLESGKLSGTGQVFDSDLYAEEQ